MFKFADKFQHPNWVGWNAKIRPSGKMKLMYYSRPLSIISRQFHFTHDKLCVLIGFGDYNWKVIPLKDTFIWPIGCTFFITSFATICNHYNDANVALPYHPPKITNSICSGSLGGDKFPGKLIAINVWCIYIIGKGITR